MSTWNLIGLPSEIAALLFTVALLIALVPIFGGTTLGSFDIPKKPRDYPDWLRKWGWLAVLGAFAMFAPAWPDPSKPFDVSLTFQSTTPTPLDCARLHGATATLRVGTHLYTARIDAACLATFLEIAAQHLNEEGRIGVQGARGFVLEGDAPQALSAGAKLTASLADVAQGPRLRVVILPSGIQSAAAQLQEFHEALTDRIINMSQSLSARGDDYRYVDRLKVVTEGPSMPSAQELWKFWETSHALEVVRGQVETGTQPLTVHSSIFLGDLAPARHLTSVPIELRITPGDFARMHDTYSVVMLYALARDAQRLKKPSDMVVALLSERTALASRSRIRRRNLQA